ncbi:hypothetical protein [Pseudanabaena galeata]|nr:hypothetical protein [Pseudanabaena galeata]
MSEPPSSDDLSSAKPENNPPQYYKFQTESVLEHKTQVLVVLENLHS